MSVNVNSEQSKAAFDEEKRASVHDSVHSVPSPSHDFDIYSYHESNAGRLVVDPAEARVEFGDKVADRLKLSVDGTVVLWPQPTDNPEDPQNWSNRKKTLQLIIITLAAIVPDFEGGIAIACLFALAKQFSTTPNEINDLTSNWSVFLIGWGGIFAVMIMPRLGRLPVLFYSQLLALAFMVGCTFSPNLSTFAAMRCLNGFFATVPQVTGLYAVADMYPFHLQARKLNMWTMGFVISPYIGPCLLGFLVARQSWRWAYAAGSFYNLVVLLLIVFLGEETLYDRTCKPIPRRPTESLRYRVETLLGFTGVKMQNHRPGWMTHVMAPLRLVWRPHLLALLIFEGALFGFSIGIFFTNGIFLALPISEHGYAFDQDQISTTYITPIVAVIVGELSGRYLADALTTLCIRRNGGVFEAEHRLWATYISVPLYVAGFVLLGAGFETHHSIAMVVVGWAIALIAVMINTVAIYAWAYAAFPSHAGAISALLNMFRTLGGFTVAYFQNTWAARNGALQTFGCEAAIVAGLWLLFVPFVQLKGRELRARYSI